MAEPSQQGPRRKGKKVRVAFRRNRSKRQRVTDVTEEARQAEDFEVDTARDERVAAKGDLSRKRTIIVPEDGETSDSTDLTSGTVVAMRGLYADVDDGSRIWPCTIRRVLRTRLIDERHPVTVGDHVRILLDKDQDGVVTEGVVEHVETRTGVLRRLSGRRIHTIAANIDQALIVTSAQEPRPKPNLIDRYIVAAQAGDIKPIICMNKIDLDDDGSGRAVLDRYTTLGYQALCTSIANKVGIDELRAMLTSRSSVIAGQSGVGKSSLLNAIDPKLNLRVGEISEQIEKGRHTTTTATLIKLGCGGYVVDTPGIRSFDLTVVPREQYEAHFIEFAPLVENCKFPDCTHTHEIDCAIKAAVESGKILPERYESYVQMYEDPGRLDS